MPFNTKRSRYPIKHQTTPESLISLLFTLRLLFFQIIQVCYFPIHDAITEIIHSMYGQRMDMTTIQLLSCKLCRQGQAELHLQQCVYDKVVMMNECLDWLVRNIFAYRATLHLHPSIYGLKNLWVLCTFLTYLVYIMRTFVFYYFFTFAYFIFVIRSYMLFSLKGFLHTKLTFFAKLHGWLMFDAPAKGCKVLQNDLFTFIHLNDGSALWTWPSVPWHGKQCEQ